MNDILIMLADGFEEVEAVTLADYLRRTGIDAQMVTINDTLEVTGAHGIRIIADKLMSEIKEPSSYRGIVIPGGRPGAMALAEDNRVLELIRGFNESGRMVAAICAGPIVLARAGVLEGKKATCFPGFGKELVGALVKDKLVVKDGNIITSRGPATASYFALRIVEYLQGEERMSELKKAILLDLVEDEY